MVGCRLDILLNSCVVYVLARGLQGEWGDVSRLVIVLSNLISLQMVIPLPDMVTHLDTQRSFFTIPTAPWPAADTVNTPHS